MITNDLIDYIKSQLDEKISKDLIISSLKEVGWRIEDINEGFSKIEASAPKIEVPVIESIKDESKSEIKTEPKSVEEKSFDPYREFPDGIDIEKEDPYQIVPKKEVKPIESEINSPTINPVFVSAEKFEPISDVKTEPEVKPDPIIPDIKLEPKVEINVEPVKIWTPTTITPKETVIDPVVETKPLENKIENYNLELEAGEVSPVASSGNSTIEPKVQIAPESHDDLIPIISKNRFDANIPQKKETVFIKQKTLVAEDKIESPAQEVKPAINPITVSPMRIMPSYSNPSAPVNTMKDIVPKSAIISSYSQDILAAAKEQEIHVGNKKSKFIKFGILLIILAVIGSLVFAFVEGYVKIPWFGKYSVVKKDPKAYLLGASDSLSSLNSYKVETNVEISTPSLSSITTGLANGESVNNKNDRDSISFNTRGFADRSSGKLNYQYIINLKSSILKNDIVSDLKYDGNNLYASVPDLKEILKTDAPAKNVISFTPEELEKIVNELSPKAQNVLRKIDGYSLSSGKIPLYVKTKTRSIFEEFINSLTYVEKGKDTIHNVETYHYELTADRQSTKKFLVSLSDLFVTSATDEQKNDLDEMLGASSISSFDIWIGVEDNNLYQIEFKLKTPLSKVLGLNDSGIAGNEMEIDWRITYYDLNIPNKVLTPEQSINMDSFVSGIKDIKIKNIISSFKPEANSLKNAIGSFGSRTNPTGSCANPNPSSLFSPLGHKKGSEAAVGTIALSLKSLMSVTNGAGLCYSTPKEWALSVPLPSSSKDSPQFFCADSHGSSLIIPTVISGTFCK